MTVSSDRHAWETRLMRAASTGGQDPNVSVVERAAADFLRSYDEELDIHTATVLAELVAADVPVEERVGFVQMWMRELHAAQRRT